MKRKSYKNVISFICMFLLSISLLNSQTVNAETINNTSTNAESEYEVSENKEIVLFHTNDTHSRVEVFPKMKAYVKAFEGNSLLLDAGDTFHGQSFATLEKGSSIAKILNAMGYAAMVPGNHDFNYGQDELRRLSAEANVPVLAVNIKKDGTFAYEAGAIKQVNGVNVGILGVATPETAYKTNPVNVTGLDFGDKESIIDDTQRAVNALRAEGADVIVVLTHLGIDPTSDVKSTDIGEAVTGIDVIIDGHSHSTLDQYKSFNDTHKTQITSTGNYLANFGEVKIVLDDINNVLEVNVGSVVTDELTEEDAEIRALIDGIKKGQEVILNEVVAETPIELDGLRENVRSGHTNLGRLITSAILDETGADISLTNGGGIRDSIKAGKITKGDIITVLPFGNYIVTKEVTGQDIIDALNFAMSEANGGFPHFGGMNVSTEKYVDENGTIRWRVVSVDVKGEPINPSQKYVLATNDFTAVGGDGYTMFENYPILNEYSALDEALIRYISKIGADGIIEIDKEVRLAEAEIIEMDSLKERLELAVKDGFKVELRKHNEEKTLVVLTKDGEKVEFLVNGTLEEVDAILKEVNEGLNDGEEVPPTEEEKDEPSDTKPEEDKNTGTNNETDKETGKGNSTLPQTGGTSPVIPVALGIMVITIGAIVFKKKDEVA